MSEAGVSRIEIQQLQLWKRMKDLHRPLSFSLEVTARCNYDCRHCYINLPAGDRCAKQKELTLTEIEALAGEAASLGAFWCLVTGGEPLLREDFSEIYLALRRKGLLVSVFTNAALLTMEHVQMFKKYPPRDIEVTIYGATKQTYDAVTRRTGSFEAAMRGIGLLTEGGLRVRFKAMALRSNVHELPEIAAFCRERTADYFRFDPLLHLRFDRNPERNEEIKAERLAPHEIAAIERSDRERFEALLKGCDRLIIPQRLSYEKCMECSRRTDCEMIDRLTHVFLCGTGSGSFDIGHDGVFRLCSALWHPECIYDLTRGSLADAWQNFVPRVRDMRSNNRRFLQTCQSCRIANLCYSCPAHNYLETGETDVPVEYFCRVAHARAEALGYASDRATSPSRDSLTVS